MEIEWLGHSSFLLTESTGVKIVTDPYNPSVVGYKSKKVSPDIVTISHAHDDHNFLKSIGRSKHVITAPGDYDILDEHIVGVRCFHDASNGSERGENIVFKYRLDGVNVCHMGDIGQECTPELIEQLLPVNVLMIPIGGNYTIDPEAAKEYIDRIMPDIVLPMHYKRKHCELDIERLESFLKLFNEEDAEIIEDVDVLRVDRSDLGEFEKPKIVVLQKQPAGKE